MPNTGWTAQTNRAIYFMGACAGQRYVGRILAQAGARLAEDSRVVAKGLESGPSMNRQIAVYP